jgi:hypothetical protein
MTSAYHDHASRAAFMASALAAGTGRHVASPRGHADAAVARKATALCTDTIQSILTTALAAERIAATLYYAALTTPAVMRNSALAGRSGNPNDPGLPPGGHPQHVRFLQAALDAELKHAALLSAAGARSPYTRAAAETSAVQPLARLFRKYGMVRVCATACNRSLEPPLMST